MTIRSYFFKKILEGKKQLKRKKWGKDSLSAKTKNMASDRSVQSFCWHSKMNELPGRGNNKVGHSYEQKILLMRLFM